MKLCYISNKIYETFLEYCEYNMLFQLEMYIDILIHLFDFVSLSEVTGNLEKIISINPYPTGTKSNQPLPPV